MINAALYRSLDAARSPMQELVSLIGPQAVYDSLTPGERTTARYCWDMWARRLVQAPPPAPPKKSPGFGLWRGQLAPPGDWSIWLYMAGRGSGKTRTGAEQVRKWKDKLPGCRIALVGSTAADVWGTMVEGESGILACCPPWDQPKVHTMKRRLKWRNGSMAFTYSAEKSKRLRGPQHHFAWADELGAWRNLDTYDQLMFGLRLGAHPQALVTTTPLPMALLRELIGDPAAAVTIGSSKENSGNLSPDFFKRIVKKYEGSILARQELEGELLDEMPGALWKREWFRYVEAPPKLDQVAIGLDPSETSTKGADDTGIVAVGRGEDGLGYVLEDDTCHETPDAWARRAVAMYWRWGAGQLVLDVGRNGEMAKSLIKLIDPRIRVVVKGGNKTKRAWAETVSAIYEQGRMRHVGTRDPITRRLRLAALEDQMCTWTEEVKDWSPDRMDAAVYAASAVMLNEVPRQSGLNQGAATSAGRRM